MTRFRSIEQPPTGRSVSIELNGHAYEGTYTVNGPMLSLDTLTLGVRRAPLGDYAPEVLARLLLAELVYDSERAHGQSSSER